MTTKIKHRSRTLVIISIISLSLIFIACVIPVREIGMIIGIISIIAINLSFLSMILSAILKTTVTIEDGIMSVKYFLFTDELNVNDITSLSFTHKRLVIKGRTEYRVNLKITTQKDNAPKELLLNDNATIHYWHFIDDDEQMADEDIPLYHVYLHLKELTK